MRGLPDFDFSEELGGLVGVRERGGFVVNDFFGFEEAFEFDFSAFNGV